MRVRRYLPMLSKKGSVGRAPLREPKGARELSREYARPGMEPGPGIEGVVGLGDVVWGVEFPASKSEILAHARRNDCIYYEGACYLAKEVLGMIADIEYEDLLMLADEVAKLVETKARPTTDRPAKHEPYEVDYTGRVRDEGRVWESYRYYREKYS